MGDLFGGGSSKQKVTTQTVLPPEVTQAMQFATNFGKGLVNQGPPQSFQDFLTSGIRGYPGQTGSSAPPSLTSYTAPTGSIEQFLSTLAMGGPSNFGVPVSSLTAEMARGEAPGNTLAQFRNELDRSQAQVMESLGTTGQRFGTGLAETMDRNAQEALTSLGAETEKNSLAATTIANQQQQQAIQQWLVTLGALMGSQTDRLNTGFANLMQDFLRQSGLPPGLEAIIGGAGLGRGAGTSTGVTKGSTSGNPLGEITQIAQAGIMAAPWLSSLFGGGGAAAASASSALPAGMTDLIAQLPSMFV